MNVLLDLDGTLTDPREGIIACIKHALAGLNAPCPPDRDLERYIGPPLHETFRRMFPDEPDKVSKVTRFAERIIEHFQLADHIRCVYGSELDGTRGNKAELISHILSAESLSATRTCIVGDREHDMIGARVNAVCGTGALWGYGSRRELLAAGASFLCEEPSRLARLLSTVPLK